MGGKGKILFIFAILSFCVIQDRTRIIFANCRPLKKGERYKEVENRMNNICSRFIQNFIIFIFFV